MLRITTHHEPQRSTLQLEGKVAGPWVQELRDCWQREQSAAEKKPLRVDLNSVTFVDQAGKQLLLQIHASGAEFVCANCCMKALVADAAAARSSSCGEISPLPDTS